jgi:hypothetical protein
MAPARPRNRYGFFPASSANYSVGQEPELARRLNKLGQTLKLHLVGLSGYRTPAHSVSVGGFPDDPHTQGRASDTPGIERVSESVLNRFGLTRPFPGAAEADHIQLFGTRGGTMSSSHPPKTGPSFTLADYWIQGGGKQNLAPIMAAIGMAESGGRIDATHTNDDGTTDDGWLQINSSHGYDRQRLRSDPVYTARAGVAIERSQGLGAWTTYRTGAFRAFMGSGRNFVPRGGRVRPGGTPEDSSSGPDEVFASYTEDASWHFNPLVPVPLPFKIPGPQLDIPVPNPLDMFKDSAKAVKDTADFLKWIAWIFHPKNVLRAVEFVTGLTLMGFGLHTLMAVYKDAPQTGAAPRAGQALRRGAGELFSMTPAGRTVRVTRARRHGKRRARAGTREVEAQAASRRGGRTERKRQARKSDTRGKRRARFSREKVPF